MFQELRLRCSRSGLDPWAPAPHVGLSRTLKAYVPYYLLKFVLALAGKTYVSAHKMPEVR